MLRHLSAIALAGALLAPAGASAAVFSFTGSCTDCALLLPTRPFDPGTPISVELTIADAAVAPGNALSIADLQGFFVRQPLVDGSFDIFGITGLNPGILEPGASFTAVLNQNAEGFVGNAVSVDLAVVPPSEEFFRLLTDAAGNWSVDTRVFAGRGTDGFWAREVPEPASAAVLGFGLLAFLRRRSAAATRRHSSELCTGCDIGSGPGAL